MKRILAIAVAAILACTGLMACSGTSDAEASNAGSEGNGKIKVIATIFPAYDWVMTILGDKAADTDVTLLLDNGVDLHSYQPTAEDISKIAACDVFIYVGGESDEWVEDVLAQATNKDMKVLNMLEILGDSVKNEEIVEGMEGEDEHEDGEDEDEHVWLSLRNAKTLCSEIAVALEKVSPENKDAYEANLKAYEDKLDELDAKYAEAVKNGSKDTILFGDRFPFRYLVDDYNLNYFAAFAGCSAETEASFETVVFLSEKVDELKLPAILKIEGDNDKLANTIKDNTTDKNQAILTLDSLQATSTKDYQAGRTYLSVMEENLEVLKEALK
jgi:zinc transport system substrate-binding protein